MTLSVRPRKAVTALASLSRSNVASANIVYKRKKTAKNRKKAKVAPSFRMAFNKLAPSKEKRFDMNDTLFTNGLVSDRTRWIYLDQIAQGTQANQRLGSNIHVSYIHVKGMIQNNSVAKTKTLRLMILKEVNLGGLNTSTFAALWKGVGTTWYAPAGTADDVRWPLNKELVRTIYDRTYKITPEVEGVTKINVKRRINRIVRYTTNDSAKSDPYEGRLILLACLSDCDNVTTATTAIFSAGVRVFFKDYNKVR